MNLNALDLNLIRVLDALLKENSVTGAGERIGLSQPAVSAALNRLRHALDDPLFVRSGNEMLPTPRAEGLREPVQQALSTIERALCSAEPFEPQRLRRTFGLLSADFFSTLFMPAFAAETFAAAPDVRIRLVDSAAGDVARLLKDGLIDVALERPLEMPEWIFQQRLFRSSFVVVARSDHPVIAQLGIEPGSTIPLDAFCALSHAIRSVDGSMSGFTDEALANIDRERNVVLALPHFHAVALAVEATDLIACLPRQFATALAGPLGLSVYQPPVSISVPEISMYWHSRNDVAAENIWLRSKIGDVVGQLGFDSDAA